MGSLSLLPLSLLSARRPATDAEYARWLRSSQAPGAPADFGGAIFPNPENIQISSDTDSGIPVTRLPEGVEFKHGAWRGTMPSDISNPPKAALSTTAAKSSAAPIDFSKYDAQGAKVSPTIDFSQYNEQGAKAANSDAGWLDMFHPDREIPLTDHLKATEQGVQSVVRAGRDFGKGVLDLVKPPEDGTESAIAGQPFGKATLPLYRVIRGMGHTVADSLQVTDAIKDINASPDPAGTYAKALQQMTAEGAIQALTAAASEGLIRGLPKVPAAASAVSDAASSAGDAVRTGVKAGSKVVQAIDPDVVGILSPRAAHSLRVAQRAAKVANKYATGAAETAPVTPGEAEPFEGVTSPQTESAGEVVEHAPTETPAQILSRGGSTAELEKALNNALGGKPLQKGVPLRAQVPGKAPAAASLPDGFTPVKSSVLRGYKYDPATQQFESVTNTGQHYVHGEVSPEAFQKFEAADSKGAAWNQLRGSPGVVGVAKGPMGKTVPITRGAVSVTSEGEATPLQKKVNNLQDFIRPQKTLKDLAKPVAPEPAAAAEPDLLSQLEESRDQALAAKRTGVTTSVKPSDLLDRWGVDPESFTEGRSQTRGMSADESTDAIKKLTAAYKKGEAIEPVVEFRDADNNIVEVDGRSRALAAHKAGIKRIPIIVRKLQ